MKLEMILGDFLRIPGIELQISGGWRCFGKLCTPATAQNIKLTIETF
jgi:hypothetical protein